MRQTLKQAAYMACVARDGRTLSPALYRASIALEGLPVGGWAETRQAWLRILDELPPMRERAYTASEFVELFYEVGTESRRFRRKSAKAVIAQIYGT